MLSDGDLEAAVTKLDSSEDVKFKTIFSQLYKLNLELDLFRRFDVDKIFEARILSVDKEYRSMGLASKLMAKCDEVAVISGFKVSSLVLYLNNYEDSYLLEKRKLSLFLFLGAVKCRLEHSVQKLNYSEETTRPIKIIIAA